MAAQKLFDSYWIIEFDEDELDPSAKAKVRYTFPEKVDDQTMARSVPQFCFPEEQISLTWEQKRKDTLIEEFSFVLTAVDGSKRFGFCRRILLKPDAHWKPLCFCLVSPLPLFSFLRAILDVVEAVRIMGPIAMDGLLEEIALMPVPDKGKDFKLNVLIPTDEKIDSDKIDPQVLSEKRKKAEQHRATTRKLMAVGAKGDETDAENILLSPRGREHKKGTAKAFLDIGEEVKTFHITRPDSDYEFLDYVNFEPLFSRFSVKDLLVIFCALMRERRVLVFSQSLGTLTSIINALVALVSPFSWQHVFIPILPRALLDFVEAPMPYVIGVLKQSKTKVFTRHIEVGTIIINADKGDFITPPLDNPDDFLPQGPTGLLRKTLERVQQSDRHGHNFNTIVAHSFLRFWVEVLKDFPECFKPETGEFDSAKFIATRPPAFRQFAEDILRSQMVDVFFHEREQVFRDKKLDKDLIVVSNVNDLKLKIDKEFGMKPLKQKDPVFTMNHRLSIGKGDITPIKEEDDEGYNKLGSVLKMKGRDKERGSEKPEKPEKPDKGHKKTQSMTPEKTPSKDKDHYSHSPLPPSSSPPFSPNESPITSPRPLATSNSNMSTLETILTNKQTCAEFEHFCRKDAAVDVALQLYLDVRKLAFEFEKVPFDFVKKVSIAAGVSTKKSEVNPNPILPLDDRLKQLIFQCIDTERPSTTLAEDLTILFKKMIEDQILPFVAARSAAHSYIPTDGKDDDDESKSMFKKGFLGRVRSLTRNKTVGEGSPKDVKNKSKSSHDIPAEDLNKEPDKDNAQSLLRQSPSNETLKESASTKSLKESPSAKEVKKDKDKPKDKDSAPTAAAPAIVEPSFLSPRKESHPPPLAPSSPVPASPAPAATPAASSTSAPATPDAKSVVSPRLVVSPRAGDKPKNIAIKRVQGTDGAAIGPSRSRLFQPITSRFDLTKPDPKQAAAKQLSPAEMLNKLKAAGLKKTIGFGKDFDGAILDQFEHCKTTLRAADNGLEARVFMPLLRVRYPPIDAYRASAGDYYAVPLASNALGAFLDFIFLDTLSISSITDPEDILDLIRFCGVYISKLRAELLLHFVTHLKIDNCIKFMNIAYELSKDPVSAKEINRALGYMKYFFVSNWEKVVVKPEVANIPSELFIELSRLTSPGFKGQLDAYKNLIKVVNADFDEDSLSHALMVLFTNQDSTDFVFHVHDRSFPVHKYVIAVQCPLNQLGITDQKEVTLPDTLLPHADIFEILLHYVYVQDFLTATLPPIDLELAHLVWQSGMFYIGHEPNFEPKLGSYFSSSLNVRTIIDLLLKMEDKAYALCLKDAILRYAAKNVSVLAESPALQKLPRPTLVSIIEFLK